MTPDRAPLPGMVGVHPSMLAVYALTRKAARAELPVVIVGETGTGKELVARALHSLSDAGDGPFIDLNCAAIQESLAEGELFGWERGAFTGAHARSAGLLEVAHGGTLFLDEACSLSNGIQAKLLRAIERGVIRRVGGRAAVPASFRLVVAISEPVRYLVRCGRLRLDFAQRISGFVIELPPLRSRLSDISVLAEHFLNGGNGHPPRRLTKKCAAILAGHPWSGNVRELEMTMRRLAASSTGGDTEVADVQDALLIEATVLLDDQTLDEAIERAGSLRKASRLLGVSLTTLRRRLEAREEVSTNLTK